MDCRASNIMTTDVISIRFDATLDEAVNILAENKISGLPVVDRYNRVIGIITETDIVGQINKLHIGSLQLFSLLSTLSRFFTLSDLSKNAFFEKGFELLSNTRIESVMSKKIYTAKADTSGLEIAGIMKREKVNRIPTADDEGKLTGIVTRPDLINYLVEKQC